MIQSLPPTITLFLCNHSTVIYPIGENGIREVKICFANLQDDNLSKFSAQLAQLHRPELIITEAQAESTGMSSDCNKKALSQVIATGILSDRVTLAYDSLSNAEIRSLPQTRGVKLQNHSIMINPANEMGIRTVSIDLAYILLDSQTQGFCNQLDNLRGLKIQIAVKNSLTSTFGMSPQSKYAIMRRLEDLISISQSAQIITRGFMQTSAFMPIPTQESDSDPGIASPTAPHPSHG